MRTKHDYSRLLKQIVTSVQELLDVEYMEPAPLLNRLLSTLRYEARDFAYTSRELMCDITSERMEASFQFAETMGIPPIFMTSAAALASRVGLIPIFGGGFIQYKE